MIKVVLVVEQIVVFICCLPNCESGNPSPRMRGKYRDILDGQQIDEELLRPQSYVFETRWLTLWGLTWEDREQVEEKLEPFK